MICGGISGGDSDVGGCNCLLEDNEAEYTHFVGKGKNMNGSFFE